MNRSPPSNTLSMTSPFHNSPHGTTTGTGTCTIPPSLSLSRYDSAPGSFLSTLVTSSDHQAAATPSAGPGTSHGGALFGRFFPGESSSSSPSLTSDSSCKVGPTDQRQQSQQHFASGSGHEVGNHDPNPLVRHSSSPAGFFSNLLMDNSNNRRLKSQLSFTRQSTLSQISEDEIPDLGGSIGGSGNHSDETRSYGFSIGSWDDTNSIVFSASANKRGKDNNGDIITNLSNIDSQFGYPRTSLEMGSVEKYLQMQQQEQVPFKIRAKRGCATHPRSIAERERRTRISEKLRKLQDLVPNMDKQTSTSDMLDMAVQHIKVLQNQVEILKQEQEKCTCGSHRRNNT